MPPAATVDRARVSPVRRGVRRSATLHRLPALRARVGQRQSLRQARSRRAGGVTPASFPAAPRSLWRFRRLLPMPDATPCRSARARHRSSTSSASDARLGLPRLYAKDESQNPTWSYKDRLCSLAVTHAVGHRRARDHDLVDGQPRRVDGRVRRARGAAVRHLHARVGAGHDEDADAGVRRRRRRVCATSESRWTLMKEGIERHGWYPTSGWSVPPIGSNPFGIEGYKRSRTRSRRTSSGRRPTSSRCRAATATGSSASGRDGTSSRRSAREGAAAHARGGAVRAARARARARAGRAGARGRAGPSVAFSIASPYGTYQGSRRCSGSGGPVCGSPTRDLRGAARLASEEGLFVEPSPSPAVTAVMQLVAAARARSRIRRSSSC